MKPEAEQSALNVHGLRSRSQITQMGVSLKKSFQPKRNIEQYPARFIWGGSGSGRRKYGRPGPGATPMNKRQWEEMGSEIRAANKTVPAAIARNLPDISKGGCTAAGWSTYGLIYAIPTLTGRLPESYLDNFKIFIEAYEMMIWKKHNHESLRIMKDLWIQFVRGYERLYYRDQPARLRLMSSNVHLLLHIADSIANHGSVASFWEYGIERIGDMLINMVQSRRKISENVANTIMHQANLNCANLARPSLNLVSSRDQLPIPAGSYRLDKGWFLKKCTKVSLETLDVYTLVEQYMTSGGVGGRSKPRGRPIPQLKEDAESWGRYMMDSTGHIVGSQGSQRASQDTRASNYIRYHTNGNDEERDTEYGEVIYYLRVHCINKRRDPPYLDQTQLAYQMTQMQGAEDATDVAQNPRPPDEQYEHHLAVVRRWKWDLLMEGEVRRNRQVVFTEEAELQVIDVGDIEALAGRVKTAFHDFILSIWGPPDPFGISTVFDTVEDNFQ